MVPNILEKGTVVLPVWHGVNSGPAVFTVVLETSHAATEDGSWFDIRLDPMTLIAQLTIKYIWLYFYLSIRITSGGILLYNLIKLKQRYT